MAAARAAAREAAEVAWNEERRKKALLGALPHQQATLIHTYVTYSLVCYDAAWDNNCFAEVQRCIFTANGLFGMHSECNVAVLHALHTLHGVALYDSTRAIKSGVEKELLMLMVRL